MIIIYIMAAFGTLSALILTAYVAIRLMDPGIDDAPVTRGKPTEFDLAIKRRITQEARR